ncbi:butyrophilin subfamily 3 member A2-like [Channa argus]|uniref:butyrophilin subfamily 3 member A2-like n=1 Tax=Channa argus TaxID=215402 RepID=UPI00352194CD
MTIHSVSKSDEGLYKCSVRRWRITRKLADCQSFVQHAFTQIALCFVGTHNLTHNLEGWTEVDPEARAARARWDTFKQTPDLIALTSRRLRVTVQVDAALQDRRFGRRETRCLNSKVLYPMDGLCIRSSLRTISVLVVHLLIHFCEGQSQLIGSVQPIVARVGDDIMLPCHLEPVMDVAAKTLEWIRPDLNNILVHVWRSGQELVKTKHPLYTGRTSLFTDELKHGNMSLKLSGVKLSDKGTYKCFIPDLKTQSTVEVVVASDAAAPPVISLAGTDESTSGVLLQCESKGWYPEPEVLWLDGEGNVLSAGPTETVRGPDDLYTVSSRVTVDKRHGQRFTCRVQQNNINQTRETHIHFPDDFFKVQSRSSATTVGLAVSLAVSIMLSLLLLLLLWKKNMSKRNQMNEVESEGQNNDNTEAEFLTEDSQNKTKQVMTDQTAQIKHFNKSNVETNSKLVSTEIGHVYKRGLKISTKKSQLSKKGTKLSQLERRSVFPEELTAND